MTGRYFIVLAAAWILTGGAAYGLNDRSWVSNTGSGSTCTLASPCASFQAAHNATNAGGQINVLNPGDYGTLTISKAITIDGGGTFASMLVGNGVVGIQVSAGASDTVTLRNLSIASAPGGRGDGIRFFTGKSLYVENVVFSSLDDAVDVFTNAFSETFIQNTVMRNCLTCVFSSPGSGSIAAISIQNVLMEMGTTGFQGVAGTRATIRDSVIAIQTSAGVDVSSSTGLGAEANVENTSIQYTFFALLAGANATIRASRNTILNNANGFDLSGGTIISFGNNEVTGNNTDGSPSSTIALK